MKKLLFQLIFAIAMIAPSGLQALDPVTEVLICNTLTAVGAFFGPALLHYRYEKSIQTDTSAELLNKYKDEAIEKVIEARQTIFNSEKSKPCSRCDHQALDEDGKPTLQSKKLNKPFILRGCAASAALLSISKLCMDPTPYKSTIVKEFCSTFLPISRLLTLSTTASLYWHALSLRSYKNEAMEMDLYSIALPYFSTSEKQQQKLETLTRSLEESKSEQLIDCNEVIRIKGVDNEDLKKDMIEKKNRNYAHQQRSILAQIRECKTDCDKAEKDAAIFNFIQ